MVCYYCNKLFDIALRPKAERVKRTQEVHKISSLGILASLGCSQLEVIQIIHREMLNQYLKSHYGVHKVVFRIVVCV